jgi:hypothetical protein
MRWRPLTPGIYGFCHKFKKELLSAGQDAPELAADIFSSSTSGQARGSRQQDLSYNLAHN